jgi:hypothetical protein
MSKPLFFTGRKEIARPDVVIRLFERRGELSRFEAQINLSGYTLPPDAFVVVEAYHNAYLERFAVGIVGKLETDRAQALTGLEPGDRPHFRVKVIASDGTTAGRLLAAIDEVRPATEDDSGAAGSLLPLVPKSREVMGDEFWRVHFLAADELQPELWINRDVHGLFAALQNQDPKVTGLIMPEVLRQVLRGLVEDGAPWTEEGKLGQWLNLAKRFHPDEYEEWDDGVLEASRQRRREWVDAVVTRFATSHRFFERYHEQLHAATDEVNND